jgi:hypothetical protein
MPWEVITSAVLIAIAAAVAFWPVRTLTAPVPVKRFPRYSGR